MTIRAALADDQPLVRDGFRAQIALVDDIDLVAEATTGAEAIEVARSCRPDVLLMDVRMPVMDGIEATRRITSDERCGGVRVLILTTFDLDEYVYAALRAGARGFLLKDAGAAMLGEAVRAAARGDALIDPGVTVRLIQAFAGSGAAPPAPPSSPLTDREEAVLAAASRGLGNTEIGSELHISLSTVKTHLESITSKIGARNRVELAIWASERGRRPASPRAR